MSINVFLFTSVIQLYTIMYILYIYIYIYKALLWLDDTRKALTLMFFFHCAPFKIKIKVLNLAIANIKNMGI